MEVGFTAGITLNSGRVFTVDVEQLDDREIRYKSEEDVGFAPWSDIKAVMLATSDHMLEMSGYLFSVAEMLTEKEQRQPYDPEEMRAFGLNLLRQAAPRICPLQQACALATSPPSA